MENEALISQAPLPRESLHEENPSAIWQQLDKSIEKHHKSRQNLKDIT